MRRLAVTALVGMALVALSAAAAGCGADDEPGGSGTPAPSATPSALDGPLAYQRGGGLRGGVYRLVLQPDKTAVLTSPGVDDVRFTLSDGEYAAVGSALEAADVAGRTEDYAPDTPVADGIGHRVEVDGGKVSWADGGDPPAALRELTGELSKLVDEHRRKP